jgi:hypothetical protein
MAAWAVVVPFETRRHVIGDADVMTQAISLALQDVNDSLLNSMHQGLERTD